MNESEYHVVHQDTDIEKSRTVLTCVCGWSQIIEMEWFFTDSLKVVQAIDAHTGTVEAML